jgi:hypothetical protein
MNPNVLFRLFLMIVVAFVVILVFADLDRHPRDPVSPDAAEPDGWRSLFDGTTLKGWKPADYVGSGPVDVKDGSILLSKGEPLTGIVWDGGTLPLTGYEIELEAKRVDGEDFFCALTFPVGDHPCTLVCGGWGGSVVGLSNVDGYDASENPTTTSMDFEDSRWYRIRVRVTEDRIRSWIDERRVVDLARKAHQFSVRLEMDFCVPMGIATYSTTGVIRNIRLRDVVPKGTEDDVAGAS